MSRRGGAPGGGAERREPRRKRAGRPLLCSSAANSKLGGEEGCCFLRGRNAQPALRPRACWTRSATVGHDNSRVQQGERTIPSIMACVSSRVGGGTRAAREGLAIRYYTLIPMSVAAVSPPALAPRPARTTRALRACSPPTHRRPILAGAAASSPPPPSVPSRLVRRRKSRARRWRRAPRRGRRAVAERRSIAQLAGRPCLEDGAVEEVVASRCPPSATACACRCPPRPHCSRWRRRRRRPSAGRASPPRTRSDEFEDVGEPDAAPRPTGRRTPARPS